MEPLILALSDGRLDAIQSTEVLDLNTREAAAAFMMLDESLLIGLEIGAPPPIDLDDESKAKLDLMSVQAQGLAIDSSIPMLIETLGVDLALPIVEAAYTDLVGNAINDPDLALLVFTTWASEVQGLSAEEAVNTLGGRNIAEIGACPNGNPTCMISEYASSIYMLAREAAETRGIDFPDLGVADRFGSKEELVSVNTEVRQRIAEEIAMEQMLAQAGMFAQPESKSDFGFH